MSIPEYSITTFLELASDLGVRGLETGDPTSQKTDQLDADTMGKPGADSMKKLDAGYKTLCKGDTDHVTVSEKGEPFNQCDEAKEKEEIFNELAIVFNDANKKPWNQANHFLRNPTGWEFLLNFLVTCFIFFLSSNLICSYFPIPKNSSSQNV